jgi:LacI family transcriptional regulator
MKKVSLKDIAAAAGVATSTVSFVLNGKGREMRISAILETKIKALADKAGYHPNRIAVSLRTGNSKILGLIVEDISNNFFATLAKVIEKEAESYGYNVVFCSTENDDKKGRQLLNILTQQQVDGFLVTPTIGMSDSLKTLHEQGYPIVLMDRNFPSLPIPSILADNYHAVAAGMQHLISQGYNKIGFVTVNMDLVQMTQREAGYRDALKKIKSNRPAAVILKVPINTSQENTVSLISKFLDSHKSLDAIFFATNYLGIAGLESIRDLTIEIPEELGVLCFDDHDIFRLYSPAISSIRQPTEDIGVHAVKLLIEQITQPMGTPTQNIPLQFAAKLIARGSTIKKLPLI